MTLTTSHFPSLVGDFDRLFDNLNRQTNHMTYPPHNLLKVDGTDDYILELALAGYKEADLEVVQEKNTLTVRTVDGYDPSAADEGISFIHRGLSAKRFTKAFTLGEDIKVRNVLFEDGLLTINLTHEIPEEHKPKRFAINSEQVLLTE